MAATPSWGQILLRVAGCTAFFVVSFLLALWWLFPYPELARNLETLFRPTGLSARIDGLGPGSFLGLKASNVRVQPVDESWQPIDLKGARLRLLPLDAIRGEGMVGLTAEVLGGRINTRYRPGGERPSVWAQWEGIELGQLPLPPVMEGFPVSGRWSGNLETELDVENPEQSIGELGTSFAEVKVGAGKITGIPVPEVSLGEGRIEASRAKGAAKLEIGKAVFAEGELGVEFRGSLLLRKQLVRSLVDGVLSLRPNDRVSKELGLLFAVFPGSRASDGRYTARVRGDFGRVRLLKR